MNRTSFFASLLMIGVASIVGAQTFTYVGPPDGNFVEELNWEDGGGANPTNGSIDPSTDITLDLIINGDTVNSPDIDFDGSLTLNTGTVLTIDAGDDLDMDPPSTLNLTNATLIAGDDVFIGGTANLSGGSITVLNDDIEFQGGSSGSIDGTSLTATSGSGAKIGIQSSSLTINNATFLANRLSIESGDDDDMGTAPDVVATDSTFTILGNANDADGSDAGTLTLLGNSSFSADQLQEGFDLLLDNDSDAMLNGDLDGSFSDDYVGSAGADGEGASVTLLSFGASLTVPELILSGQPSGLPDPRAFIVNGLTGLTYFEDPTTWNVTDWNGLTTETLQVVSDLAGPINTDTPLPFIPEPTAILLLLPGAIVWTASMRRR